MKTSQRPVHTYNDNCIRIQTKRTAKLLFFFYMCTVHLCHLQLENKSLDEQIFFFFFLQIWSLHCRTYSVLCVHVCSCCKAIRPFAEFSTRSPDIHNQLECCGKCCGQLCLLDKAVVQKTIIDTLHKEGEPQTFIAKEAVCSQSAVSKHVHRKLSVRKMCGRKTCTTNSCRQRRLNWTKEKKNWTVAQWSKVLFSDESKFCISFGNQGPRVWRKGGEAHNPSCLKSSVKFPQFEITMSQGRYFEHHNMYSRSKIHTIYLILPWLSL